MNWIELKALNNLYKHKEININETLRQSAEFHYLTQSLKVLDRSHKKIHTLENFAGIYESQYIEQFNRYEAFLLENDLLKPQTRLDENDIKILMRIQSWKKEGVLEELRSQIIATDESLRGVSQMFFRHEKYLDSKPSLVDALKKILEVDHFSNEKDQQYIYRLECHHPVAIVLCENLDFLTKPNKPRKHGIELWYAGGKNVNKLDFADTRGLPIYYSCDWDYDGLLIIYPLVKSKIPQINLLFPNGLHKGVLETEHDSRWPDALQLADNDFSATETALINTLKKNNQWIIEESNDLLTMLKVSGF